MIARAIGLSAVVVAALTIFLANGGAAQAGLVCEIEYTVQSGDTLGQIAVDFDVEIDDILACNPDITDPDLILAGDIILIPGGEPEPPPPSGDGVTLQVIDKGHALPSTYVPEDLEDIDPAYIAPAIPGQQLQAEANAALAAMVEAAAADGQALGVTSAYRSYQEQAETFDYFVTQLGLEEAERISARAGHSEHQLGTTVDISGESVSYLLIEDLATAPEGQWLMAHAAEYGFALSYPEDSEDVTGYIFEPWHWRYIGVPFAHGWTESGMILVNYLSSLVQWGDVNCSGAVDPTDALAVLRGDTGLFYQKATGCPALGDLVPDAAGEQAAWGDVDCGTAVNPIDALLILRADASLPYSQAESCTEIGAKVPVVPAPPAP